MAEAMTPDEIRQYMLDLQKALNEGRISAKDFAEGMKDARAGVKGYTQELRSSALSFKRSMGDLASSMTESAKGAGQYGDALTKGADYLGNWMSSKGPWGKAGSLLVKGATMYANAVAKQSDALFKSYQEISRSGATAAGGITELYTNMQKFGYGIAELGNLASLVQENADSLALLGGTVFEGTKNFADMSNTIRNSDLGFKFESMGISVDNMNKGIAGYLKIQAITGQQQAKTQEELRAGAEAYIMQQDRLTKLTGASADEQQKIREAALSEERFAASQAQLRRRAVEEGNASLAEEADRREQMNIMISKQYGPEAAKAFRDSTTGYLNSPEAQKFLRTFPEARQKILEGASMDEVQAAMKRGAAATSRNSEELAKAGMANKVYINNAELYRGQAAKDLKEAEAQAADQQNVGDAATKNMTGLSRTQRDTRDAMQDLLQMGIRPVTASMEGLAKVMGTIPGVAAKAADAATGGAGGIGKPKAAPAKTTPPAPGAPSGGAPVAAPAKTAPSAPSAAPAKTAPSAPGGVPGKAGPIDNELVKKLTETGITGKREQANVLAQIQAESGGVAKSENLNYSAERLLKTFPNRIKSLEEAQQLVAQGPEAIGNKIYGGRMGNEANEGYLYRGRGLIQLTGKNNYAKYSKLLGIDLVKNPDLANDPKIAKDIAVAYFNEAKKRGTNLGDINSIGKAVGYVDIGGQETAKRAQMASQLEGQIPQAMNGGLLSGPMSGYTAMLHGTEAVVPLPNGKNIPVEMPGFTTTLSDQTGLMAQQLSKLDELVRVMQSQVNVSNKILQRSS
jgi:putative chitinase